MAPEKALPIPDEWETVEEYVDSLLDFATSNTLFQTLCGGVHILDFFTRDPPLFNTVLPEDWVDFLMSCPTMEMLHLLLRDDLTSQKSQQAPSSLLSYIRDIRKHSLARSYTPRVPKQKKLPRHVAVGMVPKKIHEVTSFADYVDNLAEEIAIQSPHEPITHFVDFGAGQNYLGRALASPPYNRHIVAVESREVNISGARTKDVASGLAEKQKVRRNKKLFKKQSNLGKDMDEAINETEGKAEENGVEAAEQSESPVDGLAENLADLRPASELATVYTQGEGRGSIQYISAMLNSGDLSKVISGITKPKRVILNESLEAHMLDESQSTVIEEGSETDPRMMAISIHSCGNLSHFGITSLLLNPAVKSIAIVGCCYNLLTEKLGPPTSKHPNLILRPNLTPINGANSSKEFQPRLLQCDPHGYPMSNRVTTCPDGHGGQGIRLNITARMMAVQAPQNWTEKESDSFFTRHYYRALLQKIFLDYGVVARPADLSLAPKDLEHEPKLNAAGTEPVIIGSLRKSCYVNFTTYVRGAIEKISSNPDKNTERMSKLSGLTDEQIRAYEDGIGEGKGFGRRKKELSIMWSLMAFSAGVVESLVVTDRWLWLREQGDVVKEAWVEAVFDYALSPRNLVVVGIKR